ncbi:mevalonate kinase [Arctopsyche grandis]|uniref:mevalonate kinase n=1 Tax=Arctopsyche grandis TaxID=121162 RepID=UPI00406D87E7
MAHSNLIKCWASAPGKVILHGEHSVVYGKTAIAASLGIRTMSALTETLENGKRFIRIHFPNLQLENLLFDYEDIHENLIAKTKSMHFTWHTPPEATKHEEYLNLVDEYFQKFKTDSDLQLDKSQQLAITIFLYLYAAIVGCAEFEFTSFDLAVCSDLSIGSGIGSSASFAVSLTSVIYQYVRAKRSDFKFTRNAEYLDDVEKNLISDWAFCCERISHGNPSGVDNAICTRGSLVEFRKGTDPIFHKLTANLKVCLVNTNVGRNTKSLVEKVASLRERYPDVLNSIMEACDNLTVKALQIIKNIEKEDDVDKRNMYYKNLSELFEINHNLLKTIGASHPTLEKICSVSNDLGFSGKLTGAGGGGFAIVLVPPYKTIEEVDTLIETLQQNKFVTQLTNLGGEGVTVNMEYLK